MSTVKKSAVLHSLSFETSWHPPSPLTPKIHLLQVQTLRPHPLFLPLLLQRSEVELPRVCTPLGVVFQAAVTLASYFFLRIYPIEYENVCLLTGVLR